MTLNLLSVDLNSPLPIAAQISEQLRWLIASSVLNSGDELPGAQDLAADLGVNVHTVRAGYQKLEAQGLVKLGRGRRGRVLGYDRLRDTAQSTSVRSFSLGVIVPEFKETYARLIEGIEAEAAEHTTMVYVANAHEREDLALGYLDRFIAKGVDGVVVAAALIDPSTELPQSGPPIVFVDSPGAPGPSIEFDLEKSQYLATTHLIEHGHSRIGYVSPPRRLANVAPKLAGHRRALHDAGLGFDESLVVEARDFSAASGHHAGLEILSRSDAPSAITATADALAVGVYRAARDHGVRIPDDLAMTSNDDAEVASLVDPLLTTVTLPLEHAGRLAVRQTSPRQDGDDPPLRTVLDLELVVRESCGCPGGTS